MSTIPPVGTSAYKAYLRSGQQNAPAVSTLHALLLNNANHFGSFGSDLPIPILESVVRNEHSGHGGTFDVLADEISDAVDNGSGNNPSVSYPSSAYGISVPKIAETEFINAELAEYYGMNKATAYQEALANTAYQRAVRDLKDAGLNPAVLFGNGRVQSANAGIYGQEAVSGSGGYYKRGSGSKGSSSNGKLFSTSAYGALAAIGGLVGIAATGRPDGFWIGSQTAQGAMNLMNAFHQRK